jgi:hypothetical protein
VQNESVADLKITDDSVTVELSGLEKAETVHGSLTIPRSAITFAQVVPDGLAEVQGFKTAGAEIPGVIKAGIFRSGQGRTFAVCHGRKPAVVLHLTGQHYDLVVVTADNSEELVAALGTGRRQ